MSPSSQSWRARFVAWFVNDPKPCPWCRGTRVFHPQLPLSCPRCDGEGEVPRRG